jgi:hypothetical protein
MAGERDRNLRAHFAAPKFCQQNQQVDTLFMFLTETRAATMFRALFKQSRENRRKADRQA